MRGLLDTAQRRALAREISRLASASAATVLKAPPANPVPPARRIGFTGPPGVGKSTLVGKLVERAAGRGTSVGVLAIDPASPYSKGAILGDRIRMDAASGDPRVFMRSAPAVIRRTACATTWLTSCARWKPTVSTKSCWKRWVSARPSTP